tara:strand:+ start:470 stop:688 length:219 start_codon:yes stop_codon:yes gene_type:complete
MAFKMKGAPFAKGKKTTIAGQSIKNENGKYSDVDTGAPIADPKGKLEVDAQGFVVDNDYVMKNGKIKRQKKN